MAPRSGSSTGAPPLLGRRARLSCTRAHWRACDLWASPRRYWHERTSPQRRIYMSAGAWFECNWARYACPRLAFPHLTLVRQQDVESALARALADRGIEVEYCTEAVSVEDGRVSAHATLRSPSGVETISCGFVAGCDGPVSTVRCAAGHSLVRWAVPPGSRPRRCGARVRSRAWRRPCGCRTIGSPASVRARRTRDVALTRDATSAARPSALWRAGAAR